MAQAVLSAEAVDLSARNARIFFSPSVAKDYLGGGLMPSELSFLIRHRDAFMNRSVLDLGVGAGRTTEVLLPLAARYVGVDLSPAMMDVVRRRFPSATFLEKDIRRIGLQDGGPFDTILAAYNLFGALTHEDRLAQLRACHAVLAPGGTLIFSAHNRAWRHAKRGPFVAPTGNPLRLAKRLVEYVVHRRRFAANAVFEREEADYALLRDISHGWQGVFYYIDAPSQHRQLEQAGFELCDLIGEDGRIARVDDDLSGSSALNYVCRRIG